MKWNIRRLLTVSTLVVVSVAASQANAAIVSVSGPNSSAGTAPAIIPPPTDILEDFVTNTGMQGFDEAQGVVTTVAHSIDGGGTIPAGTLVDSHMIFLNTPGGGLTTHFQVDWTFSQPILGVMSDQGGTLEAASTFELGAPGTNYTTTFPGSGAAAPYPARGHEAQGGGGGVIDGYVLLSPSTLRVDMRVSEPGDWIRVITLATIEVEIDIKPGSCPNPLNLKSKGVLPVAVLGTEDFDVTQIDPSTVGLSREGVEASVVPLRWAYEDVATPFEGELCDCHTLGPDGYLDLTLKFDVPELVAKLELNDIAGETIPLILTGKLKEEFGGTPIRGEDCISVLKEKEPQKP